MIKQWLLWSHDKQLEHLLSVSSTVHTQLQSVTQACIHLPNVCTKALNYTQTQTFCNGVVQRAWEGVQTGNDPLLNESAV